MDKETKEFIESQNKALIEDIANIVHDITATMESKFEGVDTRFNGIDARFEGMETRLERVEARMEGMEKRMKDDLGAIALELVEMKQVIRRIDERTQNQVESLYEEIRVTQREVAKIDEHLGLPKPFPMAA